MHSRFVVWLFMLFVMAGCPPSPANTGTPSGEATTGKPASPTPDASVPESKGEVAFRIAEEHEWAWVDRPIVVNMKPGELPSMDDHEKILKEALRPVYDAFPEVEHSITICSQGGKSFVATPMRYKAPKKEEDPDPTWQSPNPTFAMYGDKECKPFALYHHHPKAAPGSVSNADVDCDARRGAYVGVFYVTPKRQYAFHCPSQRIYTYAPELKGSENTVGPWLHLGECKPNPDNLDDLNKKGPICTDRVDGTSLGLL